MKRPDGFDRPAAPARPTPPQPRGRRTTPPTARASTPVVKPSPATPPATNASAPKSTTGTRRPGGASAPPASQRNSRREPEPPRTSEVDAARRAAAEAARSERSARRDLRRATRARKRIEKAEVRRFTARRRRTRIAILTTVGVIGALAGVVALGAFSPLFALRDVRVEGAAQINPDDVRGAVADQIGTPLPMLDASRIQAGLARFPLIQSYSLESVPPGTLVVRIVERAPVAMVARSGGFDLVDAAGVVLSSGPDRIPGYPLIDLPDGDTSAVAFTAASEVLVALPADLRAQVDSVRAATIDDVVLTLTGGQRVVWGDASDSARKAQHLSRLLAQQPASVTEYDVSSPGVGIIR